MLIVFVGPEAARVIVDTGQTAVRGEPVDVRDDVAEALLRQTVWREAAGDEAPTDDGSPSGGDVPGGNVDQVLEWVGDDPDRARRAIEVERDQANPRTTLITAASEVIDRHQRQE